MYICPTSNWSYYTIHWPYHSLVQWPIGSTTHLCYRLDVCHICPRNYWPYALIYSLLRQFRHKMMHNISVLISGTHWSKQTNEGEKWSKWSYASNAQLPHGPAIGAHPCCGWGKICHSPRKPSGPGCIHAHSWCDGHVQPWAFGIVPSQGMTG